MYSRATELRHLQSNDVYKLGVILDDNNCWKKLMEVIPKEINARACSADEVLDWEQAIATAGLKYNNDHIRLIESAIKRPGESRLFSQILFDEWGTSGRKHERPTVGVLLQLLVQAELFRAADFVAKEFLNEPPPARPLNGPAAKVDISLSDEIFHGIEDFVLDSSYFPGTQSINDNVNYGESATHNNKDFYTKYQPQEKNFALENSAPKPPPRTRLRLQMQQQQQPQNAQKPITTEPTSSENSSTQQLAFENSFRTQNMPKFSELMTNESILHSANTESTNLSDAPIPLISVLAEDSRKSATTNAESTSQVASELDYSMTDNHKILPLISELNLNGELDYRKVPKPEETADRSSSTQQHISGGYGSSSSSLSNDSIDEDIEPQQLSASINVGQTEDNDGDEEDVDDEDDDDDDNSMPNLSIFEQRSSNNDSSLTNVTGTSGENSFELSMNDCSSASNENIPCLSALQQ